MCRDITHMRKNIRQKTRYDVEEAEPAEVHPVSSTWGMCNKGSCCVILLSMLPKSLNSFSHLISDNEKFLSEIRLLKL